MYFCLNQILETFSIFIYVYLFYVLSQYLWSLLQDYHTILNDFQFNQYINYSNFVKVKQKLNDKYKYLYFNSIKI